MRFIQRGGRRPSGSMVRSIHSNAGENRKVTPMRPNQPGHTGLAWPILPRPPVTHSQTISDNILSAAAPSDKDRPAKGSGKIKRSMPAASSAATAKIGNQDGYFRGIKILCTLPKIILRFLNRCIPSEARGNSVTIYVAPTRAVEQDTQLRKSAWKDQDFDRGYSDGRRQAAMSASNDNTAHRRGNQSP